MLYSRHFSLSWFVACMWSVVEYLLLNRACSLGCFSSSFFSSVLLWFLFEQFVHIWEQANWSVVLDIFYVPFLEKYHHICFIPYFRDASFFFCTFCIIAKQLAWLVVSQWFHLLLSVFQCYLDMFPLLSHFSFSSAQLPLSMPLLVVLRRGMFVLLQLGRCHIILSRIILFVPWSYLVLGSICRVCPVVLSSGFCLGCVFFWPFSSS